MKDYYFDTCWDTKKEAEKRAGEFNKLSKQTKILKSTAGYSVYCKKKIRR